MKISRSNALRLWEQCYGDVKFAEDFHGYLMCRDAYGNDTPLSAWFVFCTTGVLQ